MSTLSKVLLGIAALFATLFAALVIFVTVVVDPNDYRPYIVDSVAASTGRSLELAGDLGLKLLPCCSISVAGAALGNPPGFEAVVADDDRFARIEEAAFSLKLWPLLTRREVIIGTVTLDGLQLDLVSLADGRANWTFTDAEEPPPTPEAPGPGLAGLRIDGLRIRDGAVRYRDLAAGQTFEVTGIRLDTDAVEYADTLNVTAPELLLTVSGSGLPEGGVVATVRAEGVAVDADDALAVHLEALHASIDAAGARMLVDGNGHFDATGTSLGGTFTLEPLAPRDLLAALGAGDYRPADRNALARLSGRGAWALSDTSLAIDELRVMLDDATLSGTAGMDDLEHLALRFDLTLDGIDLDRYLPQADAAPAAAASEPTSIPLDALADLTVDGRLAVGRLRVSGVDVSDVTARLNARDGNAEVSLDGRAGGGTIAVQGAGPVRGSNPALAGTLRLDGLSPRALLDALDATPDTADPNVLARLSGTSRWRLQPTSLALEAMAWQLDDSRISGSAQMTGFDHPAVRFQVDVDRLDVDAYLPAAAEDSGGEGAEVEIPVEVVRGLDLGGRLRAQSLRLSGLSLQNVDATINAADGVLRLDPLRAGLYGGEYRGTVAIDATGPQAHLTLEQALTAVRVSEVLKTWFDSDLLEGSLSVTLNGAGSGNTFTELLRGVGASVALDLSDGVYRGMDLLYELRRAQALLRREAAPAEPAHKETPIRTLAASGRMVDGVLRTDRINAENAYLKLLGSGGINLIDMALDYRFDAELLRAVDQGSGGRLAELVGNAVPLTLSGPVTSPRVGVDLQGMITDRLRDTVQERARDALLDRIAPRPDAKPPAEAPPAATPAEGDAAESAKPETEPPSTRDLLRRGLRDLLAPKDPPPDGDG